MTVILDECYETWVVGKKGEVLMEQPSRVHLNRSSRQWIAPALHTYSVADLTKGSGASCTDGTHPLAKARVNGVCPGKN
jgi:hypothetical protein